MRSMEFKMERPGLLEEGQKVTVTEGRLPSNYYYTIDPSLAMSANIPFRYRRRSREAIVTKVVENAALGHDWGETVYTWSSDNNTVTAKHTCRRDSNHTEEEKANSEYSVVREATCEEKGEGKYTAEFKNSAFTKQEKTVDIPALGHKLVHHDAKAATCAAEGNIEYWECSVCKKQFADSKGEVLVNTVVIKKNCIFITRFYKNFINK